MFIIKECEAGVFNSGLIMALLIVVEMPQKHEFLLQYKQNMRSIFFYYLSIVQVT